MESNTEPANECSYYLPKPVLKKEQDRLNAQHRAFTLTLGGLYPVGARELVATALQPEGGKQRWILDVGTGTGAWAIDMAMEFPHAEVLGIDLTPDLQKPLPYNCRFETNNFWDGFPQHKQKFDIVHARCISGGAPDYLGILVILLECIRPGGVLLIGEVNNQSIWTGPGKAIALPASDNMAENGASPTLPRFWFSRFYAEITNNIPIPPPATHKMLLFLNEISNGSTLYRLNSLGSKRYFAPIGWPGGEEDSYQNGDEIGRLMLENTQEWLKGMTNMLVKWGIARGTVNEWLWKANEEVANPKSQLYVGWDFAWARRE